MGTTVSTDPSPKRRLGDFEIVRELGRGEMGIVYEARQVSLNRKVALKVLSGSLGLTTKAVVRFKREAEAAAKLHHTNIVPTYATGEQDVRSAASPLLLPVGVDLFGRRVLSFSYECQDRFFAGNGKLLAPAALLRRSGNCRESRRGGLAKKAVRTTCLPLARDLRRLKRSVSALRKTVAPLARLGAELQAERTAERATLAAAPEEVKAARLSALLIKKLRRRLGITQGKLAALVGVSHRAVGSWEYGKAKPE